MSPLALKARYVFPAVGEPIPDGAVTIDGPRIVAVGEVMSGAEVRDLGNVAVLPGLVNAHTHLELGGLRRRDDPAPPASFVDWLRTVVAFRREAAADTADAVRAGLRECLREGTTTVGDIAQPDWSAEPLVAAGLDATVFLELIGPTPERAASALHAAELHVARAPADGWRPGLSPHAPYSVRPELLGAVVRLSAERRVPLAFHLAESREELTLLKEGRGLLRDFLDELGAWDAVAHRQGTRPLDYLRTLAAAHRVLVIHGNYLDDEEIAWLGRHRDRMAVVYCPRTHAYFGHEPYPLSKMLASGVTVCLGTDSLASSPDLSVLAEMRLVARHYPGLSGGDILQLGTLRAAAALGRDRDIGSIAPGKRADLAVVALDERSAADPYELIFDSDLPVVATWLSGKEA